jgi:hypothetical protein
MVNSMKSGETVGQQAHLHPAWQQIELFAAKENS